MNPTIIQRKTLHNKLLAIVQPDNSDQLNSMAEEQKFIFYQESGFSFPIEPDTTPRLYQLCQTTKERLHVRKNVKFCIEDRAHITGFCAGGGNDDYPSVIGISSGAVNKLSDSELRFLIGHELGHLIMHSWWINFLYKSHFQDGKAPQDIAHLHHVYKLLSELEADRYGYLACNDLEAIVSYHYKEIGGIDIQKYGVPTSLFLEANRCQALLLMDGGWLGNTHPANALRIEAIHAFATSTSVHELNTRMEPIIRSIFNCND